MDLLNIVYKYFRKKLDDDTENSRTMSSNGEEQEIKAGSQDKEYFQWVTIFCFCLCTF